jgi:beta-phosphoglucomutase-like phosphatase (HAD superfamily)
MQVLMACLLLGPSAARIVGARVLMACLLLGPSAARIVGARLASGIPLMGEAEQRRFGKPVGVRAKGQTRPAGTFWWDREMRTQADVLRAAIFDADSAFPDVEQDGPTTDLIDAVMSLFVAGIWVSVVSARPRAQVETQVRHLLGDGLVETIVTIDDLPGSAVDLARGGELYRLALWELGITPRAALAVVGSRGGLRTSAAAGLPAVLVDFSQLSAASCQQAHRRWWIRQAASPATMQSA